MDKKVHESLCLLQRYAAVASCVVRLAAHCYKSTHIMNCLEEHIHNELKH
jgi:hypothetical protein